MSTLIQVNECLQVSLLQESREVVLCQNTNNGEFVVWYKAHDKKSFCNGFYTFDLNSAIVEFNKRKVLEF